ncbi:MAG: transcriptional repressor [Bacteroidales bacterium]|nr:transcriptional repressor [Bacteroidales bacterium]MDT8432208.1 transcriptional repressor [Bacteroidales bacterium]
MAATINKIKDRLMEKGLKVTPQRIAILEAIYSLNNHPSAEMIMEYIRETYPGIASGTVYKVLDVLIEHQLIDRVKTDKDIMRYDGILEDHHHLYASESAEIKDYLNEELDEILKNYFQQNAIEDFEIQRIRLQINGRFLNNRKNGKSRS